MPDFEMQKLKLHYTTITNYDDTFQKVNVIFDKDKIENTLGEIVANNGLSQIRIAETEKYPHVTFFFSGGREAVFDGEKRLMVNSPKVATYDLQPEMSAPAVTSITVSELEKGTADFICLNFANPDMVGHTGDYKAIMKAVETVDDCTQKVVEAGLKNDYAFLIIADHGNADFSINPDGTPNTAHSTNLVPCFALNTGFQNIVNGKLADIAPTILNIMGVNIPKEMTGNILIK
jgi:2,3-bisphosphoglycerate-independent phosphoglycerate mutase